MTKASKVVLLFALVATGASGCSGKSSSSAPPPQPIQEEPLEDWARATTKWSDEVSGGVFSLGFSAEPPEGLFVSAVSYLREKDDYCSVFEVDTQLQASSPHANWIALVHLSAAQPGTYDVTWDDRVGGPPTAQVILKKLDHGVELERHTGLAGEVRVTRVPTSVAEWHEGEALVLDATVELSREEARDLGCNVGGSDTTSDIQRCTCRDSTGSQYTCERNTDAPSCCLNSSSPRETIRFTLHADQCKARCLSLGLRYQRYCQDL